jgi:DNA invertase Pin-like site-specific DNA recombinase
MSLARATDLRPEDLVGRTWAGYVRESTKGQADRYGPDIQRTEQARFAERHGLVATGLEYLDLVSGKDTLRRSDFTRMVGDAEAGAFDVLLVYDTSRFARNIEDAYAYRRRIAAAGVTVVFCADNLIAGNVDTYELEGLKTVADAAYIRRLSRNVGRGYEQKWRLFHDPGGHPPLGFARTGERQLLQPIEGPDLERVRRAFSLYALGTWSDVTLADELDLTEAGLAEILVNPLYAGRVIRHKGKPDQEERQARFPAPVDPALFERVQAIREERRTRHPGRTVLRRPYPLVRLMRCIHCDSTFQGDSGNGYRRIRHARRPVCSPSATYRAERYEDQVAALFDGATLDDADVRLVLGVMRATQAQPVVPDPSQLGFARERLQRDLNEGGSRSTCSAVSGGGSSGRPSDLRPDPTSCAWPGHGTRCLTSAPCGATRRCPTDSARRPSGRSSSASTWTARRSSPLIRSRTRTRGCWASWRSVRNGCARNE